MGQIHKVVDKLRTGCHTKSIIEDLGEDKKIHPVQRRVESYNSHTGEYWIARAGTDVQNRPVPILLEAHTGGIDFLLVWHFVFVLMRNKQKESKPDSRPGWFLITWHEWITQETRDTAKLNCKKTIGKQKMPEEEQEGTNTIPSCSDDKMTKSIEKFMDGQDYCQHPDYLTTIDISHSATWHTSFFSWTLHASWTCRHIQRRRRKRRQNGGTCEEWTIHRFVHVTQREEIDIDFRVSGLPHAVVKEAEFRVQELVKKIENHPHRDALQADLQQKNVYNSFSNNSKAMIRELCNVELFELCETVPKVKCSHCRLCWNQGIVYCTCGQFLVDSESRRKLNKLRLNALSIAHYVIKKGRCHGARHGKTEEQKEYQKAWNAWKRCCKIVDSQGAHFTGIRDRFLGDQVCRESQLAIGRTEQKCIEMDALAKQNHTYHLSTEEFKRYQGQWYLTLNKSGKNAPMRLRPDFRAAVSLKNRLHRESGEQVADSRWDTSDWSWWSSYIYIYIYIF